MSGMWIKCSDKTPERNGIYLCAFRGVGGYIYYAVQGFATDLYDISKWDFGDKKGVSGFYWMDEITEPIAWQKIERYKEQE